LTDDALVSNSESEALICERNCGYEEALTLAPKWFNFPSITKDVIAEREALSKFMTWLHFEKHVKFMKREKQTIVPDMTAWSFYFSEFLGIDKFTDGEANTCEKCAMGRVISHLMED